MTYLTDHGAEKSKEKILEILTKLTKKYQNRSGYRTVYFGPSNITREFEKTRESEDYQGEHKLGSLKNISVLLGSLYREGKIDSIETLMPVVSRHYRAKTKEK